MPAASRLTMTLAAYLFASSAPTAELFAADRDEALSYIHEVDQRFGARAAAVTWSETTFALGDHPEIAADRWLASLETALMVVTADSPRMRTEVML